MRRTIPRIASAFVAVLLCLPAFIHIAYAAPAGTAKTPYACSDYATVKANSEKNVDEITEQVSNNIMRSAGFTEEQMITLQDAIAERRDELDAINAELDTLYDAILSYENEAKAIDDAEQELEEELSSLEERLNDLNDNINDNKTLLGYYLCEEYKFTNNGLSEIIRLLFSSDSASEVLYQLDFWSTLNSKQKQILDALEKEQSAVDEDFTKTRTIRDNISELEASSAAAKQVLEEMKLSYTEKIESVQSDISLLQGRNIEQQNEYLARLYESGALSKEAMGDITESEAVLRAAIVKTALSCIGADYVWGGESWEEGGFDCSGLCQYSYAKNGLNIMRVAVDQYNSNPSISKQDLLPGDLIFFGSNASDIYHVVMYIGDGLTVEAPQTGDIIRIRELDGRQGIYGYASPISAYSFS